MANPSPMIPAASAEIALAVLSLYASPYAAGTPSQQEATVQRAAAEVERRVKELIGKLFAE